MESLSESLKESYNIDDFRGVMAFLGGSITLSMQCIMSANSVRLFNSSPKKKKCVEMLR